MQVAPSVSLLVIETNRQATNEAPTMPAQPNCLRQHFYDLYDDMTVTVTRVILSVHFLHFLPAPLCNSPMI